MDPLRAIAQLHGVFLTHEAHAVGWNDKAIARAVRGRLWHRVRRGAFVPEDVWLAADATQRHRILVCAVHRSYGDRVAISHVSAAVTHGIATWNVDLGRVHVTRLDGGAGRTEPDVVHHEALCLDEVDVTRHDSGMLVVTPARAALETGILTTTEGAVVTLDSVQNLELATATEIGNAYDLIQHWPCTQHLQVAVRVTDGRAQSVGESRCRWLFFSHGVPAPELQFEVRDARGRLIGTTDFAWPGRGLLGEFDGRIKYGRLLRPGQEPGEAVFGEKVREDALRRTTGHSMVRIIWGDLARPIVTAGRVRELLAPAA